LDLPGGEKSSVPLLEVLFLRNSSPVYRLGPYITIGRQTGQRWQVIRVEVQRATLASRDRRRRSQPARRGAARVSRL